LVCPPGKTGLRRQIVVTRVTALATFHPTSEDRPRDDLVPGEAADSIGRLLRKIKRAIVPTGKREVE
jgi:hypothetical protein